MWFQLSSRWSHHTAGQHRASCWTISVWQQRGRKVNWTLTSLLCCCVTGDPGHHAEREENFPTRINEELHFVIISLSLPLNRHETLKSSQLFLHTAGMTHAQIQRDECLTFCSALICFVKKLKHIKHPTFGSWCSCSH